MHHRKFYGARRHLQFVAQAFRKAAHREFRGGVSGLSRRRDNAKNAGEVEDMGLTLARKMWQERTRRMHPPPKADVNQPVHLGLGDLIELAAQRNAGIVVENVKAR